MIHKCPICRHQPILGCNEYEFYCPECGWHSETTKMVVEKII